VDGLSKKLGKNVGGGEVHPGGRDGKVKKKPAQRETPVKKPRERGGRGGPREGSPIQKWCNIAEKNVWK